MADTTQEQLLRLFEEAAGNEGSADKLGAEAYSLTGVARSGGGTTGTAPKGNPNPNTPTTTPTGNTGITAESVATTVLESGLGLAPLIAGIIGLFEGGQAAPEVLTKYAMPYSIQFEGDTSSGATGIDDFDQMGMPRADAATPDGAATQTNALLGATPTTNGTGSGATGTDDFYQMVTPRADPATPDGAATQTNSLQSTTTPTNVATLPSTSEPDAPRQTTAQQTVAQQTVAQPGDPQWFMDHSSEIAQAVRSAMLNLSSLNDVVSDL